MRLIRFIMNFIGIQNSASGIILKNGKVLLTKRSKAIVEGGKWCLPGGHIKKWETAESAMIRELKEETGYDVKKIKLLFLHEEFVKRLGLHANVFVFDIEISGKINQNWEVSDCGWFSQVEIAKMNLAFTHKDMVNKYFKMNGK